MSALSCSQPRHQHHFRKGAVVLPHAEAECQPTSMPFMLVICRLRGWCLYLFLGCGVIGASDSQFGLLRHIQWAIRGDPGPRTPSGPPHRSYLRAGLWVYVSKSYYVFHLWSVLWKIDAPLARNDRPQELQLTSPLLSRIVAQAKVRVFGIHSG